MTAVLAQPLIVVLLGVMCLVRGSGGVPPYPHIVVVMADDLGWNDVSYQTVDSLVQTPNIDALAAVGVKLSNFYVQPVCSPSRVAFLTGRYPHKIGVVSTFEETEKSCMPFVDLLPQTLSSYGYTNHLVGKWHLGFCKSECLPTSRGFHTFSGFYNGGQDYYTHIYNNGYDWRLDTTNTSQIMWDYDGQYGLDLMDNRINELISGHDKDTPMFLFYAMQTVHSPIQPRAADEAIFSSVTDDMRRKYLGLLKGMDDSVDVLVTALKNANMYDDSIIIFQSDNGGNPVQGANNWPLSGKKGSFLEGGIRAPAFVVGKGLQVSGVVSNGLMHVSDWFPTLMSAIGVSYTDPNFDGVDQWNMISNGGNSARTEIVHSLKTRAGTIRKGDMKLITGQMSAHERIAPPEGSATSVTTGLSTGFMQLYNITADPNETTNLVRDRAYAAFRIELEDILTSKREQGDVGDSVHVEPDPSVANKDSDGAYITGWC